MATIPFDEIVPGATVRFTTIDGMQYLSVSDIIKHICAKDFRGASKVWRNLSDEKKKEVWQTGSLFQFPGQGQSEQPVITFKGALKLAMFLSGDKAAFHRSAMVNILSRYYAGDDSLTEEIEANAASTSPVAEMARNALAGGNELENPRKRPRVSSDSFALEISTLLKNMEMGIAGQLRTIAAGQEDVAAKQDNIYQKLFDLTNELKNEKAINELNYKNIEMLRTELQTISAELKKEKDRNELIHKEYSAELKARQNQVERQTAAISHLNNTIRAKDAQLARDDDAQNRIHLKLDALLARSV